jgi:Tfp pilus assembly protein PilF
MIFLIRLTQIFLVFAAVSPLISALSFSSAEDRDKSRYLKTVFFLLWCWYPPLIYYAGEFTSESLLIFLVSAAVYLYYKAEYTAENSDGTEKDGELSIDEIVDAASNPEPVKKDVTKQSFVLFVSAGIISGMAVITHPIALFFCIGELAYMLLRKKIFRTLLVLLGILVAVMPVALYNLLILNSPVPLQANSGFNLYLGNNEKADGTCYIRPGKEWDDIHLIGRYNAEKEGISKDAYFIKEAFKFAAAHPVKFIALSAEKAFYFWNWRELTSGNDLYTLRYWTNYQKIFKWAFGLCAVLALTALFVNYNNPGFYFKYRHFLILLAAFFIANVIFVASARYRIAAVPSVLLLAAWTIVSMKEFISNRKIHLCGALVLSSAIVFIPQPPFDCNKEKAEAYSLLGEAFMLRKEYLAAEKYLTYALDYDPENTRNCNLMGIIKEKRGYDREALDYYMAALKLDKNNQYTLMNLAMFFSTHGKPVRAEELYRKAFSLKVKPKAELYYNYALFCNNTGRKKKAFANYLRCIMTDPAHVEALNNLGVLLLQIGEYKDAVIYFKQALDQDPGNPDRILNLAVAEYELGHKDRAKQLIDKALRIAPDFTKAKIIQKQIEKDKKLIITRDSQ